MPGLMARLSQVLRIPDGVQPTEEDVAKIRRAMEGALLGKLRVRGEVFDAFVSNPAINQIELCRRSGAHDDRARAGRHGPSVLCSGRYGSTDPLRAGCRGRSWRSPDAGKAPCCHTRSRRVPRRVPPGAPSSDGRGSGMTRPRRSSSSSDPGSSTWVDSSHTATRWMSSSRPTTRSHELGRRGAQGGADTVVARADERG